MACLHAEVLIVLSPEVLAVDASGQPVDASGFVLARHGLHSFGTEFPSLPLSCPPEGGDLELSNTSKTLYSSEDVSPAFETSVFCKVLLYLREEEEGDLATRTAAFPK